MEVFEFCEICKGTCHSPMKNKHSRRTQIKCPGISNECLLKTTAFLKLCQKCKNVCQYSLGCQNQMKYETKVCEEHTCKCSSSCIGAAVPELDDFCVIHHSVYGKFKTPKTLEK